MDNVTQIAGLAGPDVRELRSRIAGEVYVPGDEGWDEARQAWNLAVDQRPTAVVVVEGASDVAETIDFARENDLRVAPQGTGHAASAFADLHDTILLKTHRLRGVTIDPDGGSPAPRPARSGSTSSRRPPSTASPRSPAPRRTSASSATRSAAGSRGSHASTASAPTT